MKRPSELTLLSILLVGTLVGGIPYVQSLENKVTNLEDQLRNQVCPGVQITCNCPDYEEGWDDAEYAEGCDPQPLTFEELEMICAEFNVEEPEIPGC